MEEKGKKLGLWNIIGLGLGGAIGTGIFVLLGYGIAYTGRSISLVVAIGCFFMLLAYWYNLAMPAMFVMKGGDYSMKAMLFNPFMSGVSAWMILVNGLAMSSYSVALAQYLAIAIPSLQNHQTLVAFIAMTLFFLSTIKGSRFITILENIITLVLVASLVIFVVFGLPKVDFANTFSSADGGFFHGGFTGFVSALAVGLGLPGHHDGSRLHGSRYQEPQAHHSSGHYHHHPAAGCGLRYHGHCRLWCPALR